MRRSSTLSSISVLAALLGLAPMIACEGPEDEAALEAAQRAVKVKACGLDDGSLDPGDTDLRACEPGNTKKTTICHVPPGNPANAHTLCIGNAAVKHHLKNHDDYLGPCKRETMCPPPAPTPVPTPDGGGTGGSGGAGGAGGAGGQEVIQ